MKPLGPAIASILDLAFSRSPPSANALYTSGSNLPSRRSNAACTSAKGLSDVIRTWTTENRDSVMASPPGNGSTPSTAEPTAHPQVKACVFGFPVVRMECARGRLSRALRYRRCWRRVGPVHERPSGRPSAAEPVHHEEEHRRQEDAEQGHAKGAPQDGGAQRAAHLGAGASSEVRRHHLDKARRGHQDRPQPGY